MQFLVSRRSTCRRLNAAECEHGYMGTANATQQRLTDLRNALLRLHKTLLDSEQRVYEHDVQRINSRGQLLHLVMSDPWFAYLHELSEMVVHIDETAEATEPPPREADANRLVARARALVTPAEEGTGFAKRYFEALQNYPDVVMAHSDTLRVLERLAHP